MGHFDETTTIPDIVPVSDQLVDISFSLTEQASDQFEISGGWGAGMFIGSIGITINNLSTRRLFDGGEWRPYPRGQNQSLSLRAQSNGQYYKALSLSFMEPWLGGKKPVSLSVGAHYSDETDAYYLLQKSDKHFRTVGVSLGIGQRLMWPDPNFELYNEVSYTAYMLQNWNYFIPNMTKGMSNIFALNTTFARNTLDSPEFPTSGSGISLSLSLTPPYSLFDGKDYSDAEMPLKERHRWVEYHKWKFKGDWYTRLDSRGKFVFKAAAELGYLGHYNKNKLSPFEGFDVGGSGMSGYNMYGVDIVGLRGYDDGALTPQLANGASDYARVYNKYTAELRYMIINQPASTIYGLAFAEGGNAYREWKEFNPFQIKRALGVGVRIRLPMVGMLGFDWGWGFDAQAGETKRHGSQVTFTFGNQF
jgi:outer membrane protein insertion porin family